ncbi:MAG: hypothetical protein WBA73_02830 [Devosia sp.]
MRIRRIRMVLPARLAADAHGLARQAGTEIAARLEQAAAPQPGYAVTVPGNGRNAAQLARAAADAIGTRRH